MEINVLLENLEENRKNRKGILCAAFLGFIKSLHTSAHDDKCFN